MAFVLSAGTSSSYSNAKRQQSSNAASEMRRIMNLVDPAFELTDPTPNIHELFVLFTDQLFFGALGACTVEWSPRMTSCAGICSYHPNTGMCVIRLSEPLLKLRSRKDLIETLLHEMIHAYLFVTQRDQDRDGHGPNFQEHMHRINSNTGTNITVFHSFHAEVAVYKQHWWRCQGSCRDRAPYFGWVKRALNRAPGPNDNWWAEHSAACGGMFVKVKEPEPVKKTKKKAEVMAKNISSKDRTWLASLPIANTKGMTLGDALKKELERKIPKKSSSGVKRKAIEANDAPKENVNPSSSSKQLKIDLLFPGKGYTLGGGESKVVVKRPSQIRAAEIKIVGQTSQSVGTAVGCREEITFLGQTQTQSLILGAVKKEEIIFIDNVGTPTKPLVDTNRSSDIICLD